MKTTHLSRAVVGIAFVLSASWTWADVSLGSLERTATGVVFRNGNVRRALEFYGPNTVRVKTDLGRDHWKHPSLAVIAKPRAVAYAVSETPEALLVKGPAFTVRIDRASGAVSFVEGEKTLLAEPAESVTITEKDVDGEPTYEVTQRWTPAEGEGLYGLGQAASGKLNLRGQRIKIVQTNIPAFSPVWSSSKGYMILWDVYSQSVFHDQADGLSLWSESAPGGSDYYFMYGADPDRRFAEYRMLTGAATLFPKATFGYFQSKERYKSAQELIDIVGRFRKEGFPIDWIVQDWQYWDARNERWNAMQWDKTRYPDPKGLCDTLHNDLHVKLITSIWPDVGDDTDVARELDAHKLRYAPGHWISKGRSHVYDAYSKLGREIYFKHLKKGLIDVGVDAMWMDGSELETRDACHNADKMVEQIKACGRNEMGDFTRYLNTYGLVTTMGNYEGQRATSDKRTFTLTRTAWAGLQRYAAIPWSGDTGASWGRLRDEIAGGLGASMSGLPYWTQDTGGFFCGHYGRDAMNNPEYLELLARWNQFAIFNPIYRWHVSSPVAKEPFRARERHPEYYASFLAAAKLRYRLLPYIYSLARDVHETGRPFVRPAWIDFPSTPDVNDDQTSIVFGPSLYTSVITRPIYTAHLSAAGSPVPGAMLATPDGKAGVKVEYFKGQDLKAKVSETVVAQVNDTFPGPPLVAWPEGLSGGDDFSARYTGRLTIAEPGVYDLGVEADDGFALWLDGEEKFRDWGKKAARSRSTRVTVPAGGQTFDFRIDYFNDKFARSVKFWMRTPEEIAKAEQESRKVEVRLPFGADWYDFRTGERFVGGTKLEGEYPIDTFPLFVKAGSILPLGPDVQYATEKTDKPTELRVYPGADATFTLYADDNETYAYEKGAYEKIPLVWNDAAKTLTIGAREGTYPGQETTRTFTVVCGKTEKTVRYDGTRQVVALSSAASSRSGRRLDNAIRQ